ncbi:MAG: LysR family transcriptional regulator [Clostridia bacterium]
MNIESLKYFFLIAQERSISNVAKSVHLTQSALSQQIQKLESDLSRQLLIRSNKGVELTKSGEVVYKYAKNILRVHEKMITELAEAEKANIVIKIQSCNLTADYILPCMLIQANGVYPNHNYELTNNLLNEIITNVANDICEIGFASVSDICIDEKELAIEKVGINRIVLITKYESDFPDSMPLEKLLESNLIMYTENNCIMNVLTMSFKKAGYDINHLKHNLCIEGFESAKILVAKSFGAAFVPYVSVKEELYKKEFKIIALPELNLDLDIIMMYKKNCSGYVKDFVTWFKKYGPNSFC